MENSQSTVLICGAGPAGLMAAIELSRLQIPVRLIDKLAEPQTNPRATGVQPRTLELLEQRGILEALSKKGVKGFATNIHGQGKLVAKTVFANNGSDFPYIICLPQNDTEEVLRGALEKQGVAIERCVELVAFSQKDPDNSESVKTVLKHKNGTLEEFDCAYLIATDGSRSISRTTLNLNFTGKTRDEIFIVADVVMDSDLTPNELHLFASEKGFVGAVPTGEGNRHRVFASVPQLQGADTKVKTPTLDEIQKIFDLRAYAPVRLSNMTSANCFRINCRMIDRLRVGRVFLAGDAAHVQGPLGGQGMNAGIQELINLSWKLSLVMKGKADPKILDTYSIERIAPIRDVLTQTDGMTSALGAKNLLFRLGFNFVLPFIAARQFFQTNLTKKLGHLSLNYRNSAISMTHSAVGTLRGGDRIPDLKVQLVGEEGEGKPVESLLHLLSINIFTLLFANLTNTEATSQSAESSLAVWKGLIQTYAIAPAPGQETTFRSVLGSQSAMILVRPDGYAAFVGTENSLEAMVTYLNTWFPNPCEVKQ